MWQTAGMFFQILLAEIWAKFGVSCQDKFAALLEHFNNLCRCFLQLSSFSKILTSETMLKLHKLLTFCYNKLPNCMKQFSEKKVRPLARCWQKNCRTLPNSAIDVQFFSSSADSTRITKAIVAVTTKLIESVAPKGRRGDLRSHRGFRVDAGLEKDHGVLQHLPELYVSCLPVDCFVFTLESRSRTLISAVFSRAVCRSLLKFGSSAP